MCLCFLCLKPKKTKNNKNNALQKNTNYDKIKDVGGLPPVPLQITRYLEEEKRKINMEVKPTKARNWFLTINEQAECYARVIDIVESYEKCQFSLILHDKDNEEQPHYHVAILFENARTFEQLQKKFPGAHIEIMESKYKSFRYLLHLDDSDKYQYDSSELKERGNNVEYYSTHDEYIKLDTESLLENLENGTIKTFIDAIKLFGVKQSTTYRNTINQLLQERFTLSLQYTTEDEVQKLRYKVQCYDYDLGQLRDEIERKNNHITELEEVNNKLIVRLRQLEEYEKIVRERGIL